MLALRIKERAIELGFDLVGIAPAGPSVYGDFLRSWLGAGRAGEMAYLERRVEERIDPGTYFPGAKSVVCVAMNYHAPLKPRPAGEIAARGRIARYALGDDYHDVMKPRLHALADFIRQIAPESQTRAAVDTAPILERELAMRAGIGWIGKNTCVINEGVGSWIFLGEVLTTLELPADVPSEDHCGSCRRCLDACPTGALTEAYEIDARRCISYLTIEHPGELSGPESSMIGDWLYGCDICQDVCPHNGRALETIDPALTPRFEQGSIELAQVLGWDVDDYRRALRNSAMRRVKLPVWQRNARDVETNLHEPAEGR